MKVYQCIIIAALSLLTAIFSAIALYKGTSSSNTSAKTPEEALQAEAEENIPISGNNNQAEQAEVSTETPPKPNLLEVSSENNLPEVNADEEKHSGRESTASSLEFTPPQTPTDNNAAQHRMHSPASSLEFTPPQTPTDNNAAQHRMYSPASPEHVEAAVARITNDGASLLSPV